LGGHGRRLHARHAPARRGDGVCLCSLLCRCPGRNPAASVWALSLQPRRLVSPRAHRHAARLVVGTQRGGVREALCQGTEHVKRSFSETTDLSRWPRSHLPFSGTSTSRTIPTT